MTKTELIDYATDRFSADPEYPWEDDQVDFVLRHGNSKKWFALYMEVKRERLGLEGSGTASVLNVKTGPLLQGSYLGTPGIFPAYHMNKTNWVTVVLDTVDRKTIEELLDISWDLTQ